MALVQRTHGRDKNDAPRQAPLARAPSTHAGNLFNELHKSA
jgi:hypothetical protein